MQDLTYLELTKLAVHQLPPRGSNTGVLSNALTPLAPEVRLFFEERIKDTLRMEGMPIEFVPDHESPVPEHVKAELASKAAGFLATSQAIAQQLFDLPNTTHSEGLLCIARCKLRKNHALAVVKLEKEQGVTASLVGPEGHQHFEIELTSILLSNRTRVFKVALFIQTAAASEDEDAEFDSLASDTQTARAKVASYFLDAFLGCRLTTAPDLATQLFMNVTERFINDKVPDATERAKYQIALLAELNNKHRVVNLRGFGNASMEPEHRRPYQKALREAGVPGPSFKKNLDLVQRRLQRVELAFDNETVVITPPSQINESVNVEDLEDGRTRVRVEGKLKNVHGKK